MNCENLVERVERRSNEFLIRLDAGKYAYIKYHLGANALHIDSTFVPDEHRGRGLAETLLRAVTEYARRNNLKIVPVCSYAKRYFEMHREHENLLVKAP